MVRILLEAGVDTRWSSDDGWTSLTIACNTKHFSIAELLIDHDNGVLEQENNDGQRPLFFAIHHQDQDSVRFLLERGANVHHVDHYGHTALMIACQFDNLELVRLLLDAGVDVDARDENQLTALHYVVAHHGSIEIMRELIVQHNANMFAVGNTGRTPFDLACRLYRRESPRAAWAGDVIEHLLELYRNKLTEDHDQLVLHELLSAAEFSFSEGRRFHPPRKPRLRIILPLGKLHPTFLPVLLYTLDPALIRNRDDTGKLPIHIACQTNAPVEVLAMILELDPTTLHIADYAGALPIHMLCGATTSATEYASVRCLVEQEGCVGTLAARSGEGALPLHVLCRSTNPSLRAIQYLMQSFLGSVAMRTNAGDYPFMMAAAHDLSLASLSVVYELVPVNPALVVPTSAIQRLD